MRKQRQPSTKVLASDNNKVTSRVETTSIVHPFPTLRATRMILSLQSISVIFNARWVASLPNCQSVSTMPRAKLSRDHSLTKG